MTVADDSPDAVAPVWNLTVHRLLQAFADCPVASPDATHGGRSPSAVSISSAHAGLAGVRLTATRHVVNDIQDALRRIPAGSYGACERRGPPITTERLERSPTIWWCPICQADCCG